MSKKLYYRLAELQFEFGVTIDHIRYAVEHENLCLSFFVLSQKCVFAGHGKKGFILLGAGSLRGLLTLTAADTHELLCNKKIKVEYAKVFSSESISNWDPSNPFATSFPNKLGKAWQPVALSAAKKYQLFAKPFPEETKDVQRVFGGLLNTISQFSGEPNRPSQELLDEKAKKLPNSFIAPNKFTVELSDACISPLALELLGLELPVNSASKPHSSSLKQQNLSADEKPNRLTDKPNRFVERNIPQFHYPTSRSARLAERLIGHAPDAKSDALWSLIRKAMNDDELLDLIDPEREVLDITPDTLFWNVAEDAPEKEKKVARVSFKNTVSKVKQKLS